MKLGQQKRQALGALIKAQEFLPSLLEGMNGGKTLQLRILGIISQQGEAPLFVE